MPTALNNPDAMHCCCAMLQRYGIMHVRVCMRTRVLCRPNVLAWTSNWKYLDLGTDPGTGWAAKGFDDSTWKIGRGELGASPVPTSCAHAKRLWMANWWW